MKLSLLRVKTAAANLKTKNISIVRFAEMWTVDTEHIAYRTYTHTHTRHATTIN